jgi:hypothetical protein
LAVCIVIMCNVFCSIRLETAVNVVFADAFLRTNSDLLNAESKKIQQDPRTQGNFSKIINFLRHKETLGIVKTQKIITTQMTP